MLIARDLEKTFGRDRRKVRALAGVDLHVEQGQFTTVLGPSGCGKTTLLRCLAGFEVPDHGSITLAGRAMVAPGRRPVPAHERGVGIVPQDGALFPHLTVGQNVAFGLTDRRRRDRGRRVDEVLDLVGLLGFDRRRPHELSGGQQQRVALARALAPAPRLVLLDEPFSSLDAQLRASLRTEVRDLLSGLGTTAVLVTHDQEEAMELADRLVVMREGRVVQAGTPQETYQRPQDLDLARFLGDAVVVEGRIDAARPDQVECIFGRLPIGSWHGGSGSCRVLIRPEDIRVDEAEAPEDRRTCTVTGCSFYGHDALLRVQVPDLPDHVQVRVIGSKPYPTGAPVRLSVVHPVSTYAG
ncbi:MAG TPA: ABC transporter ATP-binding protein [Marmoricola sp.]|nr:ABC transporter ATP-binding protein [Marmoricola sp.]